MSATAPPLAATLLDAPHHDGSDAYVVERPEGLGGEATVRVRVPRGGADDVVLRYLRDGEPRWVRAVVDEETERETWWRAEFSAANPSVGYRWLLVGDGGWRWLNGRGESRHEPADADDFVLALADGPAWHGASVVYEIFPDRFARSERFGSYEPPEWALPRGWDEAPTGRGPATSREWFGGDLFGVAERLDHVAALGADVLYLTPVFPAGSTHRYDATTFDRVDPLLGGDEALRALVNDARARGMRVLGDLTTNHTGAGHEWFRAARAGGAERELYLFDDTLPGGYESWLGIPTLPKLDWGSAELRRRVAAVAARWVDAGLAGWRVDVANMTGRYRDRDLAADAARTLRAALGPDALLVAEHGYDFRRDLDGNGWHGAMNYAGFLRPVWSWLRADALPRDLERQFWGMPVGLPRQAGDVVVESMRAFRAGVPWGAVLHSWTLLDSHDTARFRTVAGTRERHLVGVGLQMTTPGVPMVFAGDELGLEGEWGEDARRPMPWGREGAWDSALLDGYRRLIALRRSSEALARGGLRYVHVADDAIAYLRETQRERLLCLALRADVEPIRVPLAALGCRELEPLAGEACGLEQGTVSLPSAGPSFHVWRLIDG